MWIKKCTVTSFVAVGMWSEEKHPKNWRNNSLFLLHDNAPAHWSVSVKISSQRTKWNVTDMIFNYFCHQCNWRFESTLLSSRRRRCLFTCSLDWNQHWSDGAFVMLLMSLRMWQKSWKGFHKMASRNVSNTFTVTGRSV